MSATKTNDKTSEPREIRRKLGLNQQQFWSKIGVTQSGGSRYESGRNMPRPVRELLRLVHVEQIDIQRIKRDDVDVVDYLKSEDPDLYKTLKKAAKAKAKMDQMYFNEYGVWPDYKEETEVLPEKQAKSDQAHLNPEADNANLKSTTPIDTKPPVD